jgi:hypothetical protein
VSAASGGGEFVSGEQSTALMEVMVEWSR